MGNMKAQRVLTERIQHPTFSFIGYGVPPMSMLLTKKPLAVVEVTNAREKIGMTPKKKKKKKGGNHLWAVPGIGHNHIDDSGNGT